MFNGLRFDLSVVSMASLPLVTFFFMPIKSKNHRIYKLLIFLLAFIPNLIFLIPNIFDIFYYPYILRRSTSELFYIIKTMKTELPSLWISYLASFVPALIILLLFGFILFYFAIKLYRFRFSESSKITVFLKQFLVFLIAIAFSIIFIRGGLQRKPISIITASLYASDNNINIVLNSTFSIIKTINKTFLSLKTFFDEINSSCFLRHYSICKQYTVPADKKNIVIIILEGFSTELLSEHSHIKKSIYANYILTPFLDSLIGESIYFTRAYANGLRSIDAIPAIFSSIPTLMNTPWILSPYSQFPYKSLPHHLKKFGYQKSVFFHGGHNGTMNFDVYAKYAGFDEYIGMNQYPERNVHYDGKWGIFDEPFLQYVASYMDTLPEPFMVGIFTLSSHHPYVLPSQYEKTFPDTLSNFHKTIAYTDFALKNFFRSIQNKSWFKNSIFVITSDHTAEPTSNYYKNPPAIFSIPLLIFIPENRNGLTVNTLAQQIDIMPTVLHLIGYPNSFLAFGQSLFDKNNANFAIQNLNDRFQIIVDTLMYIFVNDTLNNIIDISTNSDLQINQDCKTENAIMLYKSFIHQYTHLLIKSKTYCK